jgi:hypothetical protein
MRRQEALERTIKDWAERCKVGGLGAKEREVEDRGWDRAMEYVKQRLPVVLAAVEQGVPEGEPMKRKWKFVEAKDVDDFKQGTKLGGSFYDETGAKLFVIGSRDAARIETLLNGGDELADARAAIREAERLFSLIVTVDPDTNDGIEAWLALPAAVAART